MGPDAGSPLSKHPGVDKVAFTGSVNTGRNVMMGAAQGPRAVSMELGGKSPLLVFDDATVDAAVDWILTGIIWGSGQLSRAVFGCLIVLIYPDEMSFMCTVGLLFPLCIMCITL